MLTIDFKDLLLAIITIFFAVGVIYVIVALRRLSHLAEEWHKTLSKLTDMVPLLQKAVEEAEETLASTKRMTTRGEAVLEDIQIVTSSTRDVALLGLSYVETILGPLRSAAMLFQSFQTGLNVFKKRSKSNQPELEVDQEEPHE